jgi:DNA-binding response OmpR family regulator/ligand-binding sensor domain-containing protein
MRMYKLLLVIVLLPSITFCQEITFKKYGTNEGLSSNKVFSTIEDNLGFIWIATDEGVDRFDGVTFKNYKLPALEETRNSPYIEYYLAIDTSNSLWLVTSLGVLFKFDPNLDSFLFFYEISDEDGQSLNVRTIYIDHNNSLLFGIDFGVVMLDPKSKTLTQIPEVHNQIHSIIQDSNNRYYIGGFQGVVVLDSNKEYLHNLSEISPSKNTGLKGSNIRSLFLNEESNMLWMGSDKLGICAFDLSNYSFIDPIIADNLDEGFIRCIKRFSQYEIIFGVVGVGLVILNVNTQEIKHKFSHTDNILESIGSNTIYHILRNRNGMFFVSTLRGGLNVFDPAKLNFQYLKHEINQLNSLGNNVVFSISQIDSGEIAFATERGISLLDKEKSEWKHLKINDDINTDNSEPFVSMAIDKDQNLWAALYPDSLLMFKKNNKGYFNSSLDFNSELQRSSFTTLYLGLENLLWMSHGTNLCLLSLDNQKITNYFFDSNVYSLLNLSDDQLAIGSSKGVIIFDSKEEAEKKFEFIESSTLQERDIISLALDSRNKLWAGTTHDGLYIVDFKNESIQRITTNEGLLSNNIYAVVFDGKNIWISTSKGISVIDKELHISNYTESEGLISTDFNYRSALVDTDGQVYFGTDHGVVTFRPEYIKVLSTKKIIAFSEFFLNHKRILPVNGTVLEKVIDKTERIELSHKQNSFSIRFNIIDFIKPGYGHVEWKLINFDEDWISYEMINRINYTNLNPGSYTLEIRVVDEYGEIISYGTRSIDIVIKEPYWNTFWAYIVYLVSLTFFGVGTIRIYRIAKENKKSREKINWWIDITHEIKTPIMLIKAPIEDTLNKENIDGFVRQNLSIALSGISKLQNQMSQILNFKNLVSSQNVLKHQTVDIIRLLQEKVITYKAWTDRREIDLTFESEYKEFYIKANTNIIEKIISNLISNAIKYTNRLGNIIVRLETHNKRCEIFVEDSGIGIPEVDKKNIFKLFYRSNYANHPEIPGTGIGLPLSCDLAKVIGGKVTLVKTSGSGTVFKLRFPYKISDKESLPEITPNELHVSNKNSFKVLLVEDEDDFRNYLMSKLKDEYDVYTAVNGFDALECIKKVHPDIVVSDVKMPLMNGIDLTVRIKHEIETCHIPVILLTGLDSKDNIIEGLRNEADDYVSKPFNLEVLLQKIDTLIKNRIRLKNKFLLQSGNDQELKMSNSLDEDFITQITKFIIDNISDPELSVPDLCKLSRMSRTSFYHKIKSLIDLTPNEFIRTVRIKRAKAIMVNNPNLNISEVAYMTGFSDPKYFSTLFKKYFEQSPSDYIKGINSIGT